MNFYTQLLRERDFHRNRIDDLFAGLAMAITIGALAVVLRYYS